jgi:hypothetical protein
MAHFRRSARAKVLLRAEIRRDRRDAVLTKDGEVADLSLGGAYIESPSALAAGDQVWVRFVAPTAWEPLELRAEVRWIEPGGFGVAFTGELSTTEATALAALVELAGFPEDQRP